MTSRRIDEFSCSPTVDGDHGLMSPPPPQASPANRSPLRRTPGSPALLATMMPVNVMELKKEMEEESAMDNTPPYHPPNTQVKTESEKNDDMYTQDTQKSDTPIDLIYEDGNKTVIYTTASDQKGLEIYSADNSGEITINTIIAHHVHDQQIADVVIDGHKNATDGSTGKTVEPPPVSVLFQGNSHGIIQYPHTQYPGATVLVLSEVGEDGAVPVIEPR
ncbi:hypothetical protein JTB14_006577 [Gonioctena quinquepunctata]|nr:hypothetical protein JTB14_006577 [Gonioctena quinquepunctata]